MTTNKQLRELAEKATPGTWWIDSHGHRMSADGETVFIASEKMGEAKRHPETGNLSHWPNDWDASFIATANPVTVLALLDEVEALQADRDQQYDMKVRAREQRDEVTTKLSALYAECEKLRRDAELYKEALASISSQVDGNVRECVRDCVNGQPDVQDIYEYCDEIDSIIDAAMEPHK